MIVLILVPGELPDTSEVYNNYKDCADKDHRAVAEAVPILERSGDKKNIPGAYLGGLVFPQVLVRWSSSCEAAAAGEIFWFLISLVRAGSFLAISGWL